MADWQYHLELKDLREKYDKDNDMQAMCKGHVERIKELVAKLRKDPRRNISSLFADELENDILSIFEELAEEKDVNVNEYDSALEALYDWGDYSLDHQSFGGQKLCWINTF